VAEHGGGAGGDVRWQISVSGAAASRLGFRV
jgi:hypothetical protein